MKEKKYNITETFIVEPTGDSPIVSACTNFYSNNIISCSGNTEILLGEDVITFIGDVYGNNFDVDSISATTFYSGGTNLNDIILNNSIVNGSFNNEKLTLYKSNGSYIEVTGFTNTYTTGITTINNVVYFNRNDSLSAYTLDLSSLNNDKFISGVTFNNNDLILYRNDGIQLQTLINNFSGLSINGSLISDSISAITVSATTFYGDGSNLSGIISRDTYVTGGTYSNGNILFSNNSGGTFNVSGLYTGSTSSGSTDYIQIISNFKDNVILSGTTNEVILCTHHLPPNTFIVKDNMQIKNILSKSVSTATTILKIRVTTTPNPTSFTSLEALSSYAANLNSTFISFERNKIHIDASNLWIFLSTNGLDDNSNGNFTTRAYDVTQDLYIHLTAQPSIATDVLTLHNSIILKY